MIDFILATATPARVRDLLVNRGICKIEDNQLIGVKLGFEYSEVPNPLAVSGSGTESDPYVYDTRRVFLVRLSHDIEQDEILDEEGEVNFLRSKLVKFIKANGTKLSLTGVNGYSVEAWRVQISGVNVFFAKNDVIAAWQ